ncbi:MAG TPA: hypothetical protein VL651_13505 [Bacteroidia bacterium]|nr:hypothetical protein [Bacteroidia bacterium]
MDKRVLGILLFSLFFLAGKINSQTTLADSAASFPVISQHYTNADLQQMDSTKLKTIIYYYTQSFTVTPIACTDCVPFDSVNFDVSQYEAVRQWNTTYARDYDKYGFRLTLVPIKDMQYRMPIYDRYYIIPTSTEMPRGN